MICVGFQWDRPFTCPACPSHHGSAASAFVCSGPQACCPWFTHLQNEDRLFLLGLVGALSENTLDSKEPVSPLMRAGLATGDAEGPSFLALLLNLRTYAVGLAFSRLGPLLALVNDPVWNSSSFHPASALQISASTADCPLVIQSSGVCTQPCRFTESSRLVSQLLLWFLPACLVFPCLRGQSCC